MAFLDALFNNIYKNARYLRFSAFVMNYKLVQSVLALVNFLLIAFGTVGNLLTFVILMRRSIRKHSCMRYLAALCVIDILCLYTWNFSLVYKELFTSRKIEFESAFICRLFSFYCYFILQSSSWVICCIGIERVLIIASKNSSKVAQFAKRTSLITLIIVATFFCLNVVVFVQNAAPYTNPSQYNSTIQLIKPFLIPPVNYSIASLPNPRTYTCYAPESFFFVWDIVHSFMYSIIPFLIILVENIAVSYLTFQQTKEMKSRNNPATSLESRRAIIKQSSLSIFNRISHKLNKSQRTHRKQVNLQAAKEKPACKVLVTSQKRIKHAHNKSTQVQSLLLFLTVSFFWSTLPYSMFYALRIHELLDYDRDIKNLLVGVLSLMQYLRHSANFLIYLFTSSIIRAELQVILSQFRNK